MIRPVASSIYPKIFNAEAPKPNVDKPNSSFDKPVANVDTPKSSSDKPVVSAKDEIPSPSSAGKRIRFTA